MTGASFRWPLAGRTEDLARVAALTGGTVTARAVTGLSQHTLRVDPSLAGRLPFPLPREANTVATSPDADVLWLGPDEWLIVAEVAEGAASDLAATVASAFPATHHSLIDVSGGRAVVELAGDGRHHMLAGRCGLDLHPRAWYDGMCAQSLLGRAQVLLQERNETTRIFVRPSFGRYLVDILVDAAATSRET